MQAPTMKQTWNDEYSSSDDDDDNKSHDTIILNKKSVSFAPEIDYCQVLSHHDYSKEEISNTWYSRREYKKILAENYAAVKMDSHGKCLDNSACCPRGLEGLQVSERHQRERLYATQSILRQQRWRQEGTSEAPILTALYKVVSRDCREKALQRGMLDAAAVLEVTTKKVTAAQASYPSPPPRITPRPVISKCA